ncbi:YdcF family protein [Sphingorhabdus sp.]|uniref:YdcF family protein n=1 Tax=Sphingorhabdus sp. TaxID=1902408 RepID=UPI0035B410AE
MIALKKALLALLLPPTGPILLACSGLLLTRRRPRLGKFIVGGSLIGLLVLATPWVAGRLVSTLQWYPALNTKQLNDRQAIVVLGGGSYRQAPEYGGDTIGYASLERLRYALYLSKRSNLPILATGGAPEGGRSEAETIRDSAENDFAGAIRWVETASFDTADNARLSAALLQPEGIIRIVLVSHAWHLPRAVARFEANGFDVLPAPTAFSITPTDASALLPSAAALAASSRALHEWLGILAGKLIGG